MNAIQRTSATDRAQAHRINFGRLWPGQDYRADCSCCWQFQGTRDAVLAAMRDHENLIPEVE